MTDDVKIRPRVPPGCGASKSEEVVKEITGKHNAAAIQGNAFEPEDEYQQLYVGGSKAAGLLEPPYKLRMLDRLSQENNALLPCIEAMVTNVDGTGYDFESVEKEAEDEEDDAQIEALKEFFDHRGRACPSRPSARSCAATWSALATLISRCSGTPRTNRLPAPCRRQDDAADEARRRRASRADAASQGRRGEGHGDAARAPLRPARQRYQPGLLQGVRRQTRPEQEDRYMGTAKQRLPAADRATEIIHFTALPDAHTPDGVPRWINQLPSVLGSRKAEEFDFEFFDNGGVPPMLIVLQGGTLQAETRNAVEQKMSRGSAASKNRVRCWRWSRPAARSILPVRARVTVERFAPSGRTTRCSRVTTTSARPVSAGLSGCLRSSSPGAGLFVRHRRRVLRGDRGAGIPAERDEFDEIISMKLITELGFLGYRMRSKPLVIEDAAVKLEGISLAIGTNQVDMADIISEINDAVGTNIKICEQARPLQGATHTIDNEGNIIAVEQFTPPVPDPEGETPGEKPKLGAAKQPPKKKPEPVAKASAGVLALAQDTLVSLRKRNFADLAKNIALFHTLDDRGQEEFRKACATMHFIDPAHDVDGLAELAGCTIAVMHAQHTN